MPQLHCSTGPPIAAAAGDDESDGGRVDPSTDLQETYHLENPPAWVRRLWSQLMNSSVVLAACDHTALLLQSLPDAATDAQLRLRCLQALRADRPKKYDGVLQPPATHGFHEMLHLLLALLAPEVANDQLRSQHTQVTKDIQKQLLILDHHKDQNTAAVDDDGFSFCPHSSAHTNLYYKYQGALENKNSEKKQAKERTNQQVSSNPVSCEEN